MLSSRSRHQIQSRSFAATMAVGVLLIAPALMQWNDTIDPKSPPAEATEKTDGKGIEVESDKIGVNSPITDPNADDIATSLQAPIAKNQIAPPAKRTRSGAADQARATAVSDSGAVNPRCSEILARAQIGQPLSDENRALLQHCQ